MRPKLPAVARCAALLAALAAVCSVPAAAAAQAGASRAEPVKVLVAVLPFRVHSARPLDYLERSLADLLSTRLEASGRVEVVDAVTVRETLVARGDERTDDALRRLARELGAEYVVAGSLTELAGRYSLDVRVTPVTSTFAARTLAYTAGGDEELLDRVEELADRVLEVVGTGAPRARVAAVEIEGVPEAQLGDVRERLRLREGETYTSAAAESDLALLRGLAGIGTANVATARSPEGVRVTYRLVPAQALYTEGEARPRGQGPVVGAIEVRGNRRIESNAIRARIDTREGDPLDPRQLAADVREVHGLGFFADVRLLAEEGPEGVTLIFEVEENPVVRQVSISGNDNVDSEKIRDALTLTTGSTLDHPLLVENAERIKQIYQAEGFHLASVSYELRSIREDAVAVDFAVNEGDKLRLRRVVFEGNEHFSDAELMEGLKTKTWRWHSIATKYLDRSGTYAEPIFQQDLQDVHQKYLNAGYLQAEIGDPKVIAEEDGLVVVVGVAEGPRFDVGEVDVRGDETMDLDRLRDLVRLEPGEVFNRSLLTSDVELLERYYANRGFYFAKVDPLTRLDPETLTVDVTFEVEKGPLYFVREIDIAGNTNTIDPVIRREVQLVEGQLFSQAAIDISQARIRSLGFFEEVSFEPRLTDETELLDLGLKVVEKPTGSLSFGAGFSSQDSFVVTGGMSQSNLFGRGWGAAISADVGGRTDRFYLSFSDPYFLGSTWGFSASAFRTDIRFQDFEQQQLGMEFAVGHPLNREGTARGFARYSFASREVSQFSGVNAASVIFRQLLTGSESTSMLGLSFRSDTRDDRIAPTRGHSANGNLEFAGLGGFAQFLRLEGRGSWFVRPPGWLPNWWPFKDRSTIVLGARAGWAMPFNDISDYDLAVPEINTSGDSQVQSLQRIDTDLELPLTERYFLGGIGSYQMRGFRARSLGPRRAILRRTGLTGLGSLFVPVGVEILDAEPGTAEIDGIEQPDGSVRFLTQCSDERRSINFQGDGDGKCNDIRDEDIDDFEDLDETDVIGGNKFLSLSAEYRFPVSDELGLIGIVFFDVGNAFAENESLFDVGLWRYATGLGVQWFSPFGPLEAFVGMPLDKLEDEDATVFEFSVGGASF